MKLEKSTRLSLWLSFAAFIISIIMIVICILSSREKSFITLDSFVGVCVALLAILVTMILGWQIYNALEIKEKLRRLEDLEEEIKQQRYEMEQRFCFMCHHQTLTQASIAVKEKDYVNAYRFYLDSLCNSLRLEEPINTELILLEMQNCVNLIPKNSKLDKDLWDEIERDNEDIINSPLFNCIKDKYKMTYNIFLSKVSKYE